MQTVRDREEHPLSRMDVYFGHGLLPVFHARVCGFAVDDPFLLRLLAVGRTLRLLYLRLDFRNVGLD